MNIRFCFTSILHFTGDAIVREAAFVLMHKLNRLERPEKEWKKKNRTEDPAPFPIEDSKGSNTIEHLIDSVDPISNIRFCFTLILHFTGYVIVRERKRTRKWKRKRNDENYFVSTFTIYSFVYIISGLRNS